MSNQEERWISVGQAIADRIDELGLTKAEVLRRADLSDKTLNGYIAGAPIKRRDKERELALALQWEPDAFKRLFSGVPASEIAERHGTLIVHGVPGRPRQREVKIGIDRDDHLVFHTQVLRLLTRYTIEEVVDLLRVEMFMLERERPTREKAEAEIDELARLPLRLAADERDEALDEPERPAQRPSPEPNE